MRPFQRFARSLLSSAASAWRTGLWITGIAFFGTAQSASAMSLNDLSILLPLPPASQFAALLKPQDSGPQGELLPKAAYNTLPTLIVSSDPETIYQQYLRVIAIRLDPCFTEGTSTACRKQIRLVWQPVVASQSGTTTADATVHTFYEFDDAKWAQVIAAWGALAISDPREALQVHPRIRAEGYQGAYWQRLRSIILNFCGAGTLVRSTAMSLNGGTVWTFAGTDWVGGRAVPIQIPRVGRRVQVFAFQRGSELADLTDLSQFNAVVQPAPAQENLLLDFLSGSAAFQKKRTESEIKQVVQRAIIFENPKFANPGNLDCVSCHVTQTVRAWGQKNFPRWDWARDFASAQFVSAWNSENRSVNPLNTNRLRAFGYFDADPMISQRVINETAAVADRLSGRN